MIKFPILLLLATVPLSCQSQNASVKEARAPGQTAVSTNSLVRELTAMDSKLFNAIFKDCDLAALANLLTDDFEFYHDRGGLIATNASQFLEIIRKTCENQKAGKEGRSRRELVDTEVYPLARYGAVQTGVHRFFILKPGQPDEPGDIAKFTHVWKRVGDQWKIARVLSYDHRLAK